MKDGYRVIAVDMPGRWNSGQPSPPPRMVATCAPFLLELNDTGLLCFVWRGCAERVPAANYSYPQYIHDIRTLAHHLGLTKVDWLGTSMGARSSQAPSRPRPSPLPNAFHARVGQQAL